MSWCVRAQAVDVVRPKGSGGLAEDMVPASAPGVLSPAEQLLLWALRDRMTSF